MNILLIKNDFYLEMPATHNHEKPHLKGLLASSPSVDSDG